MVILKWFFAFATAAVSAAAQPRLLIFSGEPAGVYLHDAIPWGIELAKVLAPRAGFAFDTTSDAGAFTDANLAKYQAVWMNCNCRHDRMFTAPERESLQRFIRRGGRMGGHAMRGPPSWRPNPSLAKVNVLLTFLQWGNGQTMQPAGNKADSSHLGAMSCTMSMMGDAFLSAGHRASAFYKRDVLILPGIPPATQPGGTDVGNPDGRPFDAQSGYRYFGILGERRNFYGGRIYGNE